MKLKQKYTLKELSSIYGCEILGNELAEVNSICSLSKAGDKSISYISDTKHISLLTKIDPRRACSASKFEGCLFSEFFLIELISFTKMYSKTKVSCIKKKVTHFFLTSVEKLFRLYFIYFDRYVSFDFRMKINFSFE